ncbi:hypothetical protein BH11PLA2_BH11PLA2_40630 [soil metagenome]
MPPSERVAIVGLAVRFPGSGADLDQFWHHVATGVDCSREVPAGRWLLPPEKVVQAGGPQPDRVPTAKGYFLDPFEPDLTGLAIPPELVRELDPLFQLILDVGGRAIRTAKTDGVDRRRAGVILGNICLPTEKANDLATQYLGETLRSEDSASRLTHPLNRYPAGLPAGLLAKSLGFGGLSFTLDAACASTLYAVKLAADELLSGRVDLMLAGGASRPDSLYTQMGFAQLRALSGTGKCSPFSSTGDGLLVGEGAGLFVLKRLSDAIKHGDRIYAVLAGAGLSNDLSGNLLAPATEGQLRAMRAAYAQAEWQPSDVDVIECHATGTPVGDAVEFNSLRELWKDQTWVPGQCTLSSVKATVGHLLTGAGSAGIAKLLLAFANGMKPPQTNYTAPNANIDYDGGPFALSGTATPWTPRTLQSPRRAAVSGFGFGGVNAHLLFEEWTGNLPERGASTPRGSVTRGADDPRSEESIAIVGMAVRTGPWSNLREFQEFVLGGGTAYAPKPRQSGWSLAKQPGPPGYFLERLSVPLDRFRIPPRELDEMLPQQLLMLETAAAALDDCESEVAGPDPRSGVFVGLGLDLNTTNFHLRWASLSSASEGRGEPEPLTPDRVMGALGSIAASRIARAFQFGGPSFTCCSEETSAGRAIELAVRALRTGEIDRAVAGGVELTGDPRALLATHELKPYTRDGVALAMGPFAHGATPADGAAALVLKRLSDAERDGDRIYAVITGIGSAVGGTSTDLGPDAATYASSFVRACADATTDPATLHHLDAAAGGTASDDTAEAGMLAALLGTQTRAMPLNVSASRALVGHTGFAAAAVGLVKSAVSLYQQVLPPAPDVGEPRPELAALGHKFEFPSTPRYWLTNTSDGPRTSAVASSGIDGTVCHIILEEYLPKSVNAISDRERLQPLGARADGVFVLEGDTTAELLDGLGRLLNWLPTTAANIEALAREWYRRVPADSSRKLAVTFVARNTNELKEQIDAAQSSLTTKPDWPLPDPQRPEHRTSLKDRVFFNPYPLGRGGRLAFVFPGSGNQFAGMGRDVALQWPQVLRRQQSENERLRDQYSPQHFWTEEIPDGTTARDFLFGQVTLGTLTADLLVSLGIKPDAMLGFSLGESAGLFGLRVWAGRDEMYRRIQASTLFGPDLGPPYESARTFLGLKTNQRMEWISGVIAAGADDVRVHLRPDLKAYLLIVSGPNECAIGGSKADVEKLVTAVNRPFLKFNGVTLAHCEMGQPVAEPYRELHKLPVTPPAKLKVYSGAWGKTYPLTEQNCADSITTGLLNTIDLPLVVETAYRDGVRAFVEVGPGGSASRSIDAILGDRPHVARSVCVPRQDNTSLVLRLLAKLIADRFPLSLAALYGAATDVAAHQVTKTAGKEIIIPTGLETEKAAEPLPAVIVETHITETVPIESLREILAEIAVPVGRAESSKPDSVIAPKPIAHTNERVVPNNAPSGFAKPQPDLQSYIAATASLQAATAEAHARYLAVQDGFMAVAMQAVQVQNELVARLLSGVRQPPVRDSLPRGVDTPRSLTLEQCKLFATGKIGDILGPLFAEIDNYPTRVRLPDGPLMLVDRVLKIEGEPKSLTNGRVITDHTVHANRWYLDAGRCPTSVTVESGQADLFLAGFLGIDFQTKGLAVYRLLDAVVTFHRGLPGVGERIEYDIHIDEFFRQADAWLFRFRFEGTVNGQPLLSMQKGIAGFFTKAALDAGQGIIHTKLDLQPIAGKVTGNWTALAPMATCELEQYQVEALRKGDYKTAYGPDFALVNERLNKPMPLPGGMLRLVDRVPFLDPAGGRFGLGFVRAEYDLRPREWFIECHFIDDKVMPGTLMYECCLHTLRILLHRFGMIGEAGTVCEPVPGVASRLKCRGQVLETTKTVTYEVSVKEIGYGPEPYAIADALMYADGKPIVEIGNLSLRMGITRESVERLWHIGPTEHRTPNTEHRVYDSASIQAYSNGKPSEAFGEPYRIFDEGRVLARLPGPPYQFLDRITQVTGAPFVLKAAASCTAEYTVPNKVWYFEGNRCPRMPFSILLEIALQPCGWLAAYCGSALTSPQDLSFRNLGGKGVQHREVRPDSGTLLTTVTMTKVSSSAGMIIQNYDMKVSDSVGVVYEGDTYFGFFAKDALRNQVGMTAAKVPYLTDEQKVFVEPTMLPKESPFPDAMLRMVDRIDGYLPHGGVAGLGLIQGRIAVDQDFWFFKAHFYQDPVWPGSLGLESFLQLLKYVAWKKFGEPTNEGWQTVALQSPHQWTYRGQVLPSDREVTVVLEVTAEDRAHRKLTANGYLVVDGRIIYQMTDFTLQ